MQKENCIVKPSRRKTTWQKTTSTSGEDGEEPPAPDTRRNEPKGQFDEGKNPVRNISTRKTKIQSRFTLQEGNDDSEPKARVDELPAEVTTRV